MRTKSNCNNNNHIDRKWQSNGLNLYKDIHANRLTRAHIHTNISQWHIHTPSVSYGVCVYRKHQQPVQFQRNYGEIVNEMNNTHTHAHIMDKKREENKRDSQVTDLYDHSVYFDTNILFLFWLRAFYSSHCVYIQNGIIAKYLMTKRLRVCA